MRTLSHICVTLLLLAGLLFLIGPGGTAEAQQAQARKKPQLIVGGTGTGRTFGPNPCPVGCIATIVGYATHLEGIDCPLFSGEPKNETTARFTSFEQQVKKFEVGNGQLSNCNGRYKQGVVLQSHSHRPLVEQSRLVQDRHEDRHRAGQELWVV